MPVLLEKIRVILRRSDRMDEKREAENCLRCRDLTLCPDTREAFAGGRLLDLTAREFDLLRTFLEAPGRVFTREMLLARLWGYDFYGDGRVVDTHIKNLRRKLGQEDVYKRQSEGGLPGLRRTPRPLKEGRECAHGPDHRAL